jgi:hypothetical protein
MQDAGTGTTMEERIRRGGLQDVDAGTVESFIQCFLDAIDGWSSPLPDWDDPLAALLKMKRGKAGFRLYRPISLFEVGNRLCSDLTLLFGVRHLLCERALNGKVIPYDHYTVALGTADGFDIEAETDGRILVGEAYHVSAGYHANKRGASLDKLLGRTEDKYKDTNERARQASHRVIVEGSEAEDGSIEFSVIESGVVILSVPLLAAVEDFRQKNERPQAPVRGGSAC